MKRSNHGSSVAVAFAVALAILGSVCGAWAETAGGDGTLHDAAARNDTAAVAALIAGGADVDAGDYRGITPLHMAAAGNALESAKLLVARGGEVEPPRKEGAPTPLLAAVQCTAAEIARFLIGQGAVLTVEDEAGAALPSLAEENGLHDVVLHLVEQGEPLGAEYDEPGALLRADG